MQFKDDLPVYQFSPLALSQLCLCLPCCGTSLCNIEPSCFLRAASGEAKEVWIEFFQDILKKKKTQCLIFHSTTGNNASCRTASQLSGKNIDLGFPLIHCDLTEAIDTPALETSVTVQTSALQLFLFVVSRSQSLAAQEVHRSQATHQS